MLLMLSAVGQKIHYYAYIHAVLRILSFPRCVDNFVLETCGCIAFVEICGRIFLIFLNLVRTHGFSNFIK